MNDPAVKRDLRWWLYWYLRASHVLMWGILMIVLGGQDLLSKTNIGLPHLWRIPIAIVTFIAYFWWLWALSRKDTEFESEEAPVLLFAVVLLGVLAWQGETHAWAVVAISVEIALLLAWMTKVHKRSLKLAMIGWAMAGPTSLLLRWPNGDRLDVVFILGGFATALQGGFALERDLSGLRKQSRHIVAP